MNRQFRLWLIIAIVAAIIVIGVFRNVLMRQKNGSSNTPTPTLSPSSTTSTTSPSTLPTTTSSTSETSSTPTPQVNHTDEAKAAYSKKDYATAISHYTLAINGTTDTKAQAELWNLLGNSQRDSGNQTKALEAYDKAIGLNANLTATYINKSNIYIAQNKKDLARKSLEAGLAANPSNAELERELSILNLTGTGATE